MVRDTTLSSAYCLTNYDEYVFYWENTSAIGYRFSGEAKRVVAVDTKKPYAELDLGQKESGSHRFEAPYESDWALWIE